MLPDLFSWGSVLKLPSFLGAGLSGSSTNIGWLKGLRDFVMTSERREAGREEGRQEFASSFLSFCLLCSLASLSLFLVYIGCTSWCTLDAHPPCTECTSVCSLDAHGVCIGCTPACTLDAHTADLCALDV